MNINTKFISIIGLIITLLILIYLLKCLKNNEPYSNSLLNIYNKPLQLCREAGMSSGSWDGEGKCSELDGGVHQICIKNIKNNTPNFSKNTGQTDWSDKRGDNNHCVCLGAWSLYQAKKKNTDLNSKVLKCSAIPKVALSKNYVSRFREGWNKWNGLELDDQIQDGVESLVRDCYQTENEREKENLKKNYCDFAKTIPVLQKSDLYEEMC